MVDVLTDVATFASQSDWLLIDSPAHLVPDAGDPSAGGHLDRRAPSPRGWLSRPRFCSGEQ